MVTFWAHKFLQSEEKTSPWEANYCIFLLSRIQFGDKHVVVVVATFKLGLNLNLRDLNTNICRLGMTNCNTTLTLHSVHLSMVETLLLSSETKVNQL